MSALRPRSHASPRTAAARPPGAARLRVARSAPSPSAARRLSCSASSRPARPLRPRSPGSAASGQIQEEAGVAGPHRPLPLAARRQLLQRELADRLQHPEARLAVRRLALPQQALVDQRREPVEHVERRVVPARRRPPRPPPACSRRRRRPGGGTAPARAGVEQVVAPGDRVAQRPLARRRVARARRSAAAARRSSRASSAAGGEQPDPRRRQLDRQRQPVQPAGRSRPPPRRSRRSARSPARRPARALDEEPHRRRRSPRSPRRRPSPRRRAAPAAAPGTRCSPRSRSGARLVASTVRPGQAASSSATSGAAVEHLLEVVEHEQQLRVAAGRPPAARRSGRLAAARGRRAPGRPSAATRAGSRSGASGDEDDAVGEVVREAGGRPRARAGSCRRRRDRSASGGGWSPGDRRAEQASAAAISVSRPTRAVAGLMNRLSVSPITAGCSWISLSMKWRYWPLPVLAPDCAVTRISRSTILLSLDRSWPRRA